MEYSKEDLIEAKSKILGYEENIGTEESKKIWEKNAQFWDNAMGDESNEFWNCQESCSLKNTQNSLSIIVQFADCNRHYATLAVGCFSYHSRYFTGDNPSGLAVLIRSLL